MSESDIWIKDEILQLFYAVVSDFKDGTIDEETFKERLLRLAERYERSFIKKEVSVNQKDLF